jgi:hypothetical protein
MGVSPGLTDRVEARGFGFTGWASKNGRSEAGGVKLTSTGSREGHTPPGNSRSWLSQVAPVEFISRKRSSTKRALAMTT